jgi:hypothetical protein
MRLLLISICRFLKKKLGKEEKEEEQQETKKKDIDAALSCRSLTV